MAYIRFIHLQRTVPLQLLDPAHLRAHRAVNLQALAAVHPAAAPRAHRAGLQVLVADHRAHLVGLPAAGRALAPAGRHQVLVGLVLVPVHRRVADHPARHQALYHQVPAHQVKAHHHRVAVHQVLAGLPAHRPVILFGAVVMK